MRLGETQKKDCFHWQHLLAWVGGIFCALVPFVGAWEVGAMQVPVRFGAGNFGFNLLIGTGLATLGALVGGYWWRFGKWLQGKRAVVMSVAAVVLFCLGIAGMGSVLFYEDVYSIQPVFFWCVAAVIVVGLVWAFFSRQRKSHEWPVFLDLIDWLRERNRLNAIFYFLLFIALVANNISVIWAMDADFGEKSSILIGRVFTHGLLVGVCYALAELAMRSAPRFFRWMPWLVLGLVPMLVVADQLLGIMWNRPLLHVANALTSSGSLDLAVELRTSGLDVSELGAWLIVAGVFAVAMLMAGGCWLISRKFNMHASVGGVLIFSFCCWLGVLAEQGVGSTWKPVTVRQEARRAFNIHLDLFAPPQGVGKYQVAFYSGVSSFNGEIPELEHKPDVFIFMIESLRADAVRSDVTPFLSQFRDTECQPFERTWAVSNATHLSWYGFFHSRVPVFWREALEAIPDRNTYAGAVPLQQIKQAGYAIEVRAVCDFSYKDFGLSNFGLGNSLAHVLEQSDDESDLEKLNIPEREVVTFERLRAAVAGRPSGGGFYYTALDSPHYNYYWHHEFEPPFKEYDENTRFPLNPTDEEVQRVVNRYWNSAAWVDHQIREFCEYLKSQGRYDNSIIIVTGDHGEEFQERGSWFHCSSLQPEQIAVPLLIKWPSSMGRGPVQKDASHLDVMPTLMHALGLPEGVIRGLAGKNLLATDGGEHTSIATTAFAGKSGETMILRRAGYEAVFFWENYWESRVPEQVILEYIKSPDGNKMKLDTPQAYREELMRLFPDAFERFFSQFEVIQD